MAKAEVTKREIEVTLTLDEREAYVLLALTGNQPAHNMGGLVENQRIYDALSKAGLDFGSNPFIMRQNELTEKS